MYTLHVPHIEIYQSKHYVAFIQSGYEAGFTFAHQKYVIFLISANKINGKL